MSKKYTKYSNPWRKKVADIYDIPEEEMMMAKKEQVIDFERGVKAGMTKLKIDLINNPEAMIELLNMMTNENLNKVLDEFCELEPQKYCENCEHRNLSDNLEPCRDCVDYSEWETIGNEEASEDTKAE